MMEDVWMIHGWIDINDGWMIDNKWEGNGWMMLG